MKNVCAGQSLSAIKKFTYQLVSLESISNEVTRIFLKPSEQSHFSWQAGQYIKILHENGDISPLSIANAPTKSTLIELHLTHTADNSQAHDILRTLTHEKKLILRGPYGSCTPEKFQHAKRIIFLARGSGFAPIKAMIEAMAMTQNHPPIELYWSATSPDEFYMLALLNRWEADIKNFSWTPILSRPHTNWQGKTGLLQHILLENNSDIGNSAIYISAPYTVVYDVADALTAKGLSRETIFSDVFDYSVDD